MSRFDSIQPASQIGRWPHRLAVCCVFPLILVGAAVPGYGTGMFVPDWPTTYGSWFYPLRLWVKVWDLYTVVETGRWQIALTTLRVGAGSLCLALAVSTALWSHRLLRDSPP